MDETDFKILKILQKKARIPNVEVARKIGMAPSAILERIKKLEAKGIIDGYEVRLNPGRFHRDMIAFVYITVDNPSCINLTGEEIAQFDEIQEVHYLSGIDCLMVKLRASDSKNLEEILSTKIASIKTVKSMKTCIVLSSFKETARIPLSMNY